MFKPAGLDETAQDGDGTISSIDDSLAELNLVPSSKTPYNSRISGRVQWKKLLHHPAGVKVGGGRGAELAETDFRRWIKDSWDFSAGLSSSRTFFLLVKIEFQESVEHELYWSREPSITRVRQQ